MTSDSPKIKPFYLNVILLNKEDVVAAKATAKVGTGFLGKAAAFTANKLVTDETIINQLSSTLIEKISQSIHEMGISAEIIKVFQRGPFVVIKVQLTEIDKMILVLAAKGPEFASAFSSLLASLNVLGLADSVSIDDKILNQVRTGMITKFSQMIPEKMQESGLQVACTVASTEDQAEYFFETIQELERK